MVVMCSECPVDINEQLAPLSGSRFSLALTKQVDKARSILMAARAVVRTSSYQLLPPEWSVQLRNCLLAQLAQMLTNSSTTLGL